MNQIIATFKEEVMPTNRTRHITVFVEDDYGVNEVGIQMFYEELDYCEFRGELCDHINSIDELINAYGDVWYRSLEDYRFGHHIKLQDILINL